MSSKVPERTLMHSGLLPSLPLPELDQTCHKYLLSVKPFLDQDEYRHTEFVVDTFRTGVGKFLHKKLKERAKSQRNWLAEWWRDVYMAYRGPLPFFSNFGGMTDYTEFWKVERGTQIYRISLFLHLTLAKHLTILREEWPVSKMKKNIPMDMQLYYTCFASARMPGIEKDCLLHYIKKDGRPSCEMRHVVVIRRKHFFVFDALTEDYQPLNPPELEIQFQRICDMADSLPEAPGVGSLTSLDRTTWKKVQDYMVQLDEKNMEIIDIINKSIVVCVLEETEPKSNDEATCESSVGDSCNRWFDKGQQLIAFQNGMLGNHNDHAHLDGFMVSDIFQSIHDDIFKIRGKWNGTKDIRDLAQPVELKFQVDEYVLQEIEKARVKHEELRQNAFITDTPLTNFGKRFAKDVSLHPDAFIQMAVQLAYYRLHKRCVPTYETATTRQYQDGRTETLRVCTVESKAFVEAMDDKHYSVSSKTRLLRDACEVHFKMMDDCCNGQGIDRHLLGMRIVAEQEGLNLPTIFVDDAWKRSGGDGNFILSTSLSGYRSVHGGMGPMTLDGYGIFYTMEKDKTNMVVSSFGKETTNCFKMREMIETSISDMKRIILSAKL